MSFSGLPVGATGSVTFTSGAQTLCTIDDVTTTSSCTTPTGLDVGTYPVTATYTGDPNHTGSTATTTYTITKAPTALTAGYRTPPSPTAVATPCPSAAYPSAPPGR